jgi:nucleoside-diphosphate-sugar epimerase
MLLLTGATGFIGSFVATLLRRKGIRMRSVSRNASVKEMGEDFFSGDIANPDSCRDMMQDVRMVIHAAGAKRDPSAFYPVNVLGTSNLLNAAAAAGVVHFVHISSIGVLGADPLESNSFGEESACRPRNDYEQSKWEAEKLVHEACRHGLPATILRPSNVFGERDPGHGLLRLVKNVSRGHFAYLGGKNVACNYVYAEDVAHACMAVMENFKAVGRTYHVSDDCLLSEFIHVMTRELRVREPDLCVPEFVADAERKVLRYLHRQIHWQKSSMVSRWTSLNNCVKFRTNRLRDELDFTYPVGWREGLRRLIHWYRSEGLL